MKFLQNFKVEDRGQGMVEYTLIVALVVLVFWLGIRDTTIGNPPASGWNRFTDCAAGPIACAAVS